MEFSKLEIQQQSWVNMEMEGIGTAQVKPLRTIPNKDYYIVEVKGNETLVNPYLEQNLWVLRKMYGLSLAQFGITTKPDDDTYTHIQEQIVSAHKRYSKFGVVVPDVYFTKQQVFLDTQSPRFYNERFRFHLLVPFLRGNLIWDATNTQDLIAQENLLLSNQRYLIDSISTDTPFMQDVFKSKQHVLLNNGDIALVDIDPFLSLSIEQAKNMHKVIGGKNSPEESHWDRIKGISNFIAGHHRTLLQSGPIYHSHLLQLWQALSKSSDVQELETLLAQIGSVVNS